MSTINVNIPNIITSMVEKRAGNLECDGTTKLIAYYLDLMDQDFEVYVGALYFEDQEMFPHYWIEWNGYIIDFKSRMWVGDGADQGFFKKYESKTRYGILSKQNKQTMIQQGKLLNSLAM